MMIDNKPDYEFDAYLKSNNQTSILCSVALWLPKDADENVRIEIDSPEKANIIKSLMEKYVRIESEIYENNPRFVATISKAWIRQVNPSADRRKLERIRIQLLHAWDLTISEKIGSKDDEGNLAATIYFQISNLLYAEPKANRCASYLGGRKAEIEKIYTAQSPTGYSFKIEKHYSEYTKLSQNKEVVSSQNMISVTGKHKINVTEIDELHKEANDFALFLSFAARHQVMVLGYECWTGTKRVRSYKNPTDRLKVKHEEVVEDALIPLKHFELFMSSALEKWQKFDEKIKWVIKDAIVSIHPMNNSHQSYLNMFSAFEGVVNSYKTKVKTELDNNWGHLGQNFNSFIESQSLSEETMKFLKGDINQIRNREKFALKADSCLSNLNIITDDLWPVFGEKSLYQIRNLLAHGRRTELEAVYLIAQEQLQTLIERLVLALLGFDYNKSNAGLRNHGIRIKYSQQEITQFQNQLKK
jgi:hypothetical protein